MEVRSSRRMRTLVTQWSNRGLSGNENARALISMMARSKCSNQRPDTLMRDRSPPARRNHLQRTAGPYIVGQFECGRLTDWKREGRGRILRLMDDPAIKLYPDKDSGAWNWELLLKGKRIAYGESSDTQEAAYTAARQALVEERERRSKR